MGELERDCLVSHGCASFLWDRFYLNSDPYKMHVCERCGYFAVANPRKNDYYCKHPSCTDKVPKIARINIPYACKLLFQELQTMCISPRVFVTENVDRC